MPVSESRSILNISPKSFLKGFVIAPINFPIILKIVKKPLKIFFSLSPSGFNFCVKSLNFSVSSKSFSAIDFLPPSSAEARSGKNTSIKALFNDPRTERCSFPSSSSQSNRKTFKRFLKPSINVVLPLKKCLSASIIFLIDITYCPEASFV